MARKFSNPESTSSRPSAPAGDIGKVGNSQGEISSEGGQYDFLPKETYTGVGGKITSPGQHHDINPTQVPFLPGSPADELKQGGKR